jgi:Protein of unknown function (DUF3892)
MSRHQVTCIEKPGGNSNTHERISAIGGKNADGSRWKLSEDKAIEGIEDGTYEFYVTKNGKTVDVIVEKRNGTKFLKTTADGDIPDNLLSLDKCP